MIGIKCNKHLWGWWASFIFAWIQLADSLIRVISFGWVNTTWVSDFVQYQGRKAMFNRSTKDQKFVGKKVDWK